MTFRKRIIIFFQFLAVLITRLLLLPFNKTTTYNFNSENLQAGQPVCIASNHQHETDPFVSVSLLPFRIIKNLLPIRFMTANLYYFSIVRPFAAALGCFPSHRNKQNVPFGVEASKFGLRNDYSLFIFPEGKRTPIPVEAKRGIHEIVKDVENVKILLVHIIWTKRTFLLKRLVVSYKFAPATDFQNAQEILDEIYNL